ncbi:ADP-ribose glycohydrolase MACROD2 isoform X2 [Lampris incognitus]|uniref:ADP-ribose glycohydrolase MACROD2 isoform X2 n=1 Tax=Lampris incognitus TaxID=2546036 RepID=UPI0024B48B5A|nr:ADP-ribose glycohydrolase MACROD2 isoform X2 [Lampris incognitus]
MSKKKKDWKVEKERLLRLDQEERRKDYRRHDFTSLDKIPSWRQASKVSNKEEGKELDGGTRVSDKVSLYKGDITILEVDAIVNAANSSLLGGGGVDGCIHKAAGSCLYDECHSLNGCETGKAKITCGYDLPAKYVIHTVGPVARGLVGLSETKDLTSCYQNSLMLLKEHGLSSVAFPCISTGIYGFPNEPAADIALNTVKRWIEENLDKITRVIFCVFLETDFTIYKKKMSELFQGEEETGNEEEAQKDAVGSADVEMESPNQDEDSGQDEANAPKDIDKSNDNDEDEDKDAGNNKDKDEKEEEQPAAERCAEEEDEEAAEEDTEKCTVEMEDIASVNESSASNGVEMKDQVESLQESDSTATDSIQSKETHEKKE